MEISEIASKISDIGGRLYLVGGAVRDLIMGKVPHDYDYCIVGLSIDEVKGLFPDAILRGKSFPVFDIFCHEFALARKEEKVGKGHKGFNMITDKSITIEDDLLRRDITINSIAIDVLTDEIIDPYNGRQDIADRVIRVTSNAFIEDPLRSYRVARFAAELGFEILDETIESMKLTKDELGTLSVERVFVEFEKALKSDNPSIFFNVLRKANLLDVHFVEIYNLIGIIQPEKYHPEGDAYNHTMIVIDKVAKETNEPYVIFAALVHDLGKSSTPKEILPRHIGHEERGIELTKALCRRLKLPTKFEKAGLFTCKEHMKAGIFSEMRTATKVDFIERVAKSQIGLKGLEIIANADNTKIDKIEFAKVGEEMIKEVNAKAYPKDEGYNIIKEKLRRERIEWLSKNIKK